MGWSYPDISMEEMVKLIKNFIDMLILASGYQSTGRLAHWDSNNIRKTFEWALFLENVSNSLISSADYEDSVKELDGALYKLTLSPRFPQALAHLSCTSLGKASDLVLERLINPLPLRESHLNAIISASVQMDFSKLKRIDNDALDTYLENLVLVPSKGLKLSEIRNFVDDINVSTPDAVPSGKHDEWVGSDFTVLAIQQLEKRQLAVLRLSAVEGVSEDLWRTIGQSMHDELGNTSNSEPVRHSTCLIAEELQLESVIWSLWRSRSLSYFLNKRTIRLISGASLICSAPEGEWSQMFKRLDISAESDDLCETIDVSISSQLPSLYPSQELLLLGCIADRWCSLIGHLMSILYEPLTISRLCHEVFNLPMGKSLNLPGKAGIMNPQEKGVVGFLEVLLGDQINQLWKLSPVLAAVAIPTRSQLFISYLDELERQFRGNSSETRRCSCVADAMEHRECEVAERIWCIYIFHIYGPRNTSGTSIIA